MTKQEKVKFLVKLHEELGPLPYSLEEKCEIIVEKMEEKNLLKPEDNSERSMKGVF